jgi:spore coat polysaccharide biosynthesis protein SpsF
VRDKRSKTDQEEFWAGEFGDAYVARNAGDKLAGSTVALFATILARCPNLESLTEFGSNFGQNLRAIRSLPPKVELDAVEINDSAVKLLQAWGEVRRMHHHSILDFEPDRTWDAVPIKGVPIHNNPDYLPQVYETIIRASKRYILLIEYFNPTPVEVEYRGHAGRLFKRDFAGEMLERYASVSVVDYVFVWRHDPTFPLDDANWFLLEKATT